MAIKKRINLLHVRDVDARVETFFSYLRKATMILGICTVVVFGILFYKKTTVEAEYTTQLAQKEALLKESSQLESQARRLQYDSTKSRDLAKLLGSDPTFMNYFALLQGALPTNSGNPIINSFAVTKEKTFSALLSFLTYESAYLFLSNVESQQFSSVFKTLTVDSISFAIIENNVDTAVSINLSGTFK